MDLDARYRRGGGNRSRSRSQGRRSKSRSRSQSQGRRSQSRGSTQYSRRRGQGGQRRRRGRRGMRDEMVPYYPDHLAAQYGYPPQDLAYPPHLSHLVQFGNSNHRMWVKKTGGVRRAVEYDDKRKHRKKQTVWNGYAVGPGNKVFVVEGKNIREPRDEKEIQGAKRYLENSNKNEHKGNQRQGNHEGKQQHRQPRIAKSKYTTLYNDIRGMLDYLQKQSKTPNAVFKAPNKMESSLKAAVEMAKECMAGTGFFEGRKPSLKLGLPLEYLAHDQDLSRLTVGEKGPPEYLKEFANRGGEMTGQEIYKAVYGFMAKLQASIRHAVNAQGNMKHREEERERFAKEMAITFSVSVGELRTVIDACVDKVIGMNAEQLKSLKMSARESKAIALGVVLHFAGSIGGENLNWVNFSTFMVRSHEAHYGFVTAREATFKKAVKKAHRILWNRRKAEERAAGGGKPPHVLPPPGLPGGSLVNPGGGPEVKPSGLASRLISMRYD